MHNACSLGVVIFLIDVEKMETDSKNTIWYLEECICLCEYVCVCVFWGDSSGAGEKWSFFSA